MGENQNNIDNKKSQKNIKKKIIIEYVCVFIIILSIPLLWPILYKAMFGDTTTGIDGIGVATLILLILNILKYIIAFIFFIINPIRILISCRLQFKEIVPKIKRVLYIFITVFPILVGLLTIFEMPISNYMYDLKYNTSKSAYSVDSSNYKSAEEFEKELNERGLIYNKDYEELLIRLNEKYDIKTQYKKYYYEEASLMALFSGSFYDSKDENKIISFNSYEKAPVYMYNSILTLPSEGEKLQYAPISRYMRESHYPYFEDYYIECKILYVDGDIYAIIGVGESYDIDKYFRDNRENYNDLPPYCMILSEKDTITTFVNDKYHSDGAIAEGSDIEMKLNTAEASYAIFKNYPIRKVDKLDVDTINNIAKELQEGSLKESIEYHMNEN